MLQNALREGALSELDGGYELRIGLPWIRSMPLSSISALSVQLDGEPVGNRLRIRLGDRDVQAEALPVEAGWWFIQDHAWCWSCPVKRTRSTKAGTRDLLSTGSQCISS